MDRNNKKYFEHEDEAKSVFKNNRDEILQCDFCQWWSIPTCYSFGAIVSNGGTDAIDRKGKRYSAPVYCEVCEEKMGLEACP